MNLLVKKFRPLAVILLSALITISCEDPGRIGLIINADNGVISTHYQDIMLPTSMVQFDIRKSNNSRVLQVGQYTNPDYGTVTTKTFTQIALPSVDPPPAAAQYASFEMSIGFTNIIGETPVNLDVQTIDIYELAQDIDTTYDYNRLDEMALKPTPLGSWVFEPIQDDTLRNDSVYVIGLDDAVGQDLFDKFKNGDPVFDNTTNFINYFKGIALVPGNNCSDIYQINDAEFKLTINYTEENSDGDTLDRKFDFRIRTYGFYYLESDKVGAPFAGISPDNTDFDPGDGNRYLQYGTMMAIRADLSPFFLLTDTLENMIVNKAELTLSGMKDYGEYMQPPPFLQVYFTDETNEWPIVDNSGRYDSTQVGTNYVMLQDEEAAGVPPPPGVYSIPQLVYYDSEDNTYRAQMSWFLQNLYSGNFIDPEQPFLEEKGQIYIFGPSTVILPQRTDSHKLTHMMTLPADSIRLRIYYSIPLQ